MGEIFSVWALEDHLSNVLCGQCIGQVERSGDYCKNPGMLKAWFLGN